MARHRPPSGQEQEASSALEDSPSGVITRVRGAHRLPAPPSALRGRVMVAAVAAGAFAAAAAGQTIQAASASTSSEQDISPLASARDASAALGVGGGSSAGAPELLPVAHGNEASAEVQKLTDSEQVTQARQNREAAAAKKAAEEAARPTCVRPARGAFTSGFGARWGTTHFGIDIANAIGTPILAAAGGTVIEAGPASGFGLWVRIQLPDGTINVYGHMNSFSVREGQKVKAGDQIAVIGARGQVTGPHLHFEVWTASGKKIDPRAWFASRGVAV